MLRNSLQGSMFLGVEGLKHMNMWWRIKCQLKGKAISYPERMDGSQAKWFTEWEIVFLTLFLPNKSKWFFCPNEFCQNDWHFKLSEVFPPLKEKMSELLKEGTDRTWRVAEKERRESKYRTKQVFIEHATDKSRKQEREIKHSQVKSSRFC